MPQQSKNPGDRLPGNEDMPKNRREFEQKEQQRGQVVPDTGGAGAPEGGQVDGRQGDQEGTRR
jgi:hypothetical protein